MAVRHHIFDGKVIIRLTGRICETAEELLSSPMFVDIVQCCVQDLARRHSILLHIFDHEHVGPADVDCLIQTLQLLTKLPAELVPKLLPAAQPLLADTRRFAAFVEHLYNYWRSFDRFMVCDAIGDELDKRPYRTFNETVEQLTHLVRATYRDIQENVTGQHPRIYRQVRAGAEMAAIGLPYELPYPTPIYHPLNQVSLIRQVLLNPPVILNPPMNKRTGEFVRVNVNPLERTTLRPNEWLCYPAKVGPLLITIYFHERFFELGFSLSNLFELADDQDLARCPDALYLFGVPEKTLDDLAAFPTVFYDDEEHNLLVAAVPNSPQFGYFGYLKKMVLTLHNITVMKQGRLPFHGALFRMILKGDRAANVLLIGDTGTGKSETLEAFRTLGASEIQDIAIIADDMGSLTIAETSQILGYGTEIGAFLRLDDLQPGYVFGQMDRSILMSPGQVNTRVVLPVNTFDEVIAGYPVDFVLYANNYEDVDEDHPVLQRFSTPEEALPVFRRGAAMSKGTTTSTGLVESYFANIFGPAQYQDLHEKLAERYFAAFFRQGLFVGQLRTRLGLPGWEMSGPQASARELLRILSEWCNAHPQRCH